MSFNTHVILSRVNLQLHPTIFFPDEATIGGCNCSLQLSSGKKVVGCNCRVQLQGAIGAFVSSGKALTFSVSPH